MCLIILLGLLKIIIITEADHMMIADKNANYRINLNKTIVTDIEFKRKERKGKRNFLFLSPAHMIHYSFYVKEWTVNHILAFHGWRKSYGPIG